MSRKTEHSGKKGITNSFGAFGYLVCFLQWFWAILLYFSVIESTTLLMSPRTNTHVEQSSGPAIVLPDLAQMIILGIVVVVTLAVTIYALVAVPKSIVKTSNKIVHSTAKRMAPIVIKAQHQPDTKRFRLIITAKLTLAIKGLLIIIPIVLAAASGLLEKQFIDHSIAVIVGLGLATFSAMFFAIQYLLAKLLHIKISDLW